MPVLTFRLEGVADTPAGRPVTATATAPVNPFCAVTETFTLWAAPPAVRDTLDALVWMVKSGDGPFPPPPLPPLPAPVWALLHPPHHVAAMTSASKDMIRAARLQSPLPVLLRLKNCMQNSPTLKPTSE
jgi:hypothetical protein